MTEKRFVRSHIVSKSKQPDSDAIQRYSAECSEKGIKPNATALQFLSHPSNSLDLSRDYLGGNGVLLLLESAGPVVCR